jgi:ammonium transporter, Amt family
VQEYYHWGKWSTVAFCSGAIDGLVAITPAAGFVGAREDLIRICTASSVDLIIAAALAFGVVAAIACKYAYVLTLCAGIDDALQVCEFASSPLISPHFTHMQIFQHHAVGGFVGNLLTGIFAQASVAGFDGILHIKGGFLDRHYIQLGYQLLDSTIGLVWAFMVTVRLHTYPDTLFSVAPL